MGTFIKLANALGGSLTDLAWDFHVAIKHADADGAATTAGEAIELFSEFKAQTVELELEPCLDEGWSAVMEAIESERQRWLAWSEGRNHPTPEDAEVFFAFHGMPYPWGVMLWDALELCSRSA